MRGPRHVAYTARASLCHLNTAIMSVRTLCGTRTLSSARAGSPSAGHFSTTPSRKGPVARQGQFPCYNDAAALPCFPQQSAVERLAPMNPGVGLLSHRRLRVVL